MSYPHVPSYASPYANDGSEHVSDFLARMGESARSSMYSSNTPETPPSNYHNNQYRINDGPHMPEARTSGDYASHPDGVAVVDRSEHVNEFLARMGNQLGRSHHVSSPAKTRADEEDIAAKTIEDEILQGRRERQARRQGKPVVSPFAFYFFGESSPPFPPLFDYIFSCIHPPSLSFLLSPPSPFPSFFSFFWKRDGIKKRKK